MNRQDRILKAMKQVSKRKGRSAWLRNVLIDLFDIEFRETLKKHKKNLTQRIN
jgi:hypothetical protein